MDYTKITYYVCPECGEQKLRSAMVDIDGTNLEEGYYCASCGLEGAGDIEELDGFDEVNLHIQFAHNGEWRERAQRILTEEYDAPWETILDFLSDHWQPLQSDDVNCEEFEKFLKVQE